jgi:hypothetical protein
MTTPVAEPKEDGGVQVTVTLATPARRRKTGNQEGHGGKAGPVSRPRIPRITRLMALAIKFQGMLDCEAVRDYADLARLGYVTRARITQIMNLLNLAPDLQEQILFAGDAQGPHAHLVERQLRRVLSAVDWPTQRRRIRAALQDQRRSIQT